MLAGRFPGPVQAYQYPQTKPDKKQLGRVLWLRWVFLPFVKRLKGRSSRILQSEYTELRKRYWGKHFWAIDYGAWSTGNITEKIVQEYLKHHKTSGNDQKNFTLE